MSFDKRIFGLIPALWLFSFWFPQAFSATVPRPEHPRPDLFRDNWSTLNGEWQFEIDENADGEARGLSSGKELNSKVLVPFCPESKLSGVAHYGFMKNTWYRRLFDVPGSMKGKRVRLHFGAVDYQAWVWINGQPVGSHIGGSTPFGFEITRFLKDGSNELVVRVFDDTASGKQPTGKQTHSVSEGCVYTRTTGIWQPVWLEAVGSAYIESLSVVPDPDHSRVLLDVAINGLTPNLKLTATAFADHKKVGEESTPVSWRNNRLVIALRKKHLWEPGSPYLYDLQLSITRGREDIDQLTSYFGLRKISMEGRAILINGKRVFQRLILDQGFYPDGIWTAPSDEELKADIQRSMAAGYNGARLHQKVFEPRFLYWADKLGYLVWGEFPNWGFDCHPENYSRYVNEWTEVLQRDRNHPAIIGWCPFNETPAAAGELQQMVWRETKAIDPTRPVLETSGWAHTLPNPEVRDDHDYNQNPAQLRQRWMNYFGHAPALDLPARYAGNSSSQGDQGVPFMVSEFGGTFWGEKQGGWGYGAGPKNLEEFYTRYQGLVDALLDNPDMFGFCYTQLTDVEQEHNGLFYYDRRPKFDLNRLHAITARAAAYETAGPHGIAPVAVSRPEWKVLVGAQADGSASLPFRYTTAPPDSQWLEPAFDDSRWDSAVAPFGNELPGVRTPWKSSDIWLRRTFEAGSDATRQAALVIFHDEDTEVYVNGQKVWNGSGFLTKYEIYSITERLKGALKPGRNTLAVHTHQTGGGQFIDLALLVAP